MLPLPGHFIRNTYLVLLRTGQIIENTSLETPLLYFYSLATLLETPNLYFLSQATETPTTIVPFCTIQHTGQFLTTGLLMYITYGCTFWWLFLLLWGYLTNIANRRTIVFPEIYNIWYYKQGCGGGCLLKSGSGDFIQVRLLAFQHQLLPNKQCPNTMCTSYI